MNVPTDLYSFCGTSREACGFGCNLNWGDCWGQDPLIPSDTPYDIFLNGKIDGVQSGMSAAVGETNTRLKTAVGLELLHAEPLASNNIFLGITDVIRPEDGSAG